MTDRNAEQSKRGKEAYSQKMANRKAAYRHEMANQKAAYMYSQKMSNPFKNKKELTFHNCRVLIPGNPLEKNLFLGNISSKTKYFGGLLQGLVTIDS